MTTRITIKRSLKVRMARSAALRQCAYRGTIS